MRASSGSTGGTASSSWASLAPMTRRPRPRFAARAAGLATAVGVLPGFAAPALGATAPGASAETVASPYRRTDPSQDVTPGGGDLIGVTVVHGTTVKLTARTRSAVDPFVSTAWRTPGTVLSWDVYFDAVAGADARIDVVNDGAGNVGVTCYKGPGLGIPAATGTFSRVGDNGYRASVDREACLGSPPSIRVQARFAYDPPRGPLATDLAPDSRPTPQVAFG